MRQYLEILNLFYVKIEEFHTPGLENTLKFPKLKLFINKDTYSRY